MSHNSTLLESKKHDYHCLCNKCIGITPKKNTCPKCGGVGEIIRPGSMSRRRFLRARCPEIKLEGTYVHGSPIWGLNEIRRAREIRPQPHGELSIETFCISPNDNMLKMFSEGEGITGMVFIFENPLRCIQLDWFHLALLSDGVDRITEWKENYPNEEKIADKLEYTNYGRYGKNDYVIEPEIFLDILPDWVEGLIFPWGIQYPNWNEEAEVSVLEKGCKKLWNSLEYIVIDGDWLDPKTGWRKVSNRTRRKNLVAA